MSVTVTLLKVRNDLEYLGFPFDFIKPSVFNDEKARNEVSAKFGVPVDPGAGASREELDNHAEEYIAWSDKCEAKAWSDGVKHTLLDWSYHRSCFRTFRGWYRQEARAYKVGLKTFDHGWRKSKYIPCDEVFTFCTWGLKDRFFKKKITYCLCTNKQEFIEFFNRYGTSKIIYIRDAILEKWKDDCICEISW